MNSDKNIINYHGHINRKVVDNILYELKAKLKFMGIELLKRKRVYSASVECLDNIYKHAEINSKQNNTEEKYLPRFIVRSAEGVYSIETGNLVSMEEAEFLKNKVDELNSLELADVNDLYKKTMLKSAGLSDKGGAGLGLIVIAKTTSYPLSYDLIPVNQRHMYFTLTVKI
ncbi:MAG: SiaB family protein kinase [Bacteroidales bacterium]